MVSGDATVMEIEVDEDEFSDILSQVSQDFEDTCPPTQVGQSQAPEPSELVQNSTFSGIFTQIPDVQFVPSACSSQGTPIGDSFDPKNLQEPTGQQARPPALPPKLQFKISKSEQHDLGNCGVVCPPLIESENKNEPITQPTRPLKNLEKIHCATLCEENIRSYAPKNLGTFQGSLGGTNLTRIGPEQNLPPPHPEPSMGPEAPGYPQKGGCLHHHQHVPFRE